MPILATKLFIPPPRPEVVLRPRLIERLNEGFASGRRLTLISAPAGFGKTTLISNLKYQTPALAPAGDGASVSHIKMAWVSLDEGDNDPLRFLAYVIAALQTIAPKLGERVLEALQSAQPPPTEALLIALLNEIAALPDKFTLALDDYHVIDSPAVD